MKKILILAYDFPPYVSVAGLRPKSWFEEFHRHGFHPVVITRQWSNKHKGPLDYVEESATIDTLTEEFEHGTIIRTPYSPNLSNRLLLKQGETKNRLIRKSVTAFYEFSQFYLPIGPKAQLYKAAKEYLSNNKVDFIIATGEPFVLFNYAKKLSHRFNLPWIADYRDIWSGIYEKQGKTYLHKFHRLQEKRIVPSAKVVTTVSSLVAKSIFKVTGNGNIEILPNGFDSDSMKKANLIHQKSDVLRIGMAGSILPWNPTEPFFKAVQSFHQEYPEKRIEFHFYGVNNQNKFEALLNQKFPEIVDLISIHPKMPNQELHLTLSEFNALLLFNNFSFMGTKIYDHLGLRRKILLCFSDDIEANIIKENHYPIHELATESEKLQQDLIEKTNSGITVKNQNHFIQVLNELHRELLDRGQIECDSEGVEGYSRKIQVEQFAQILKGIDAL